MKQVLQNLRNGETVVTEVPVPTPQPGEVLVSNAASLVSAGTERMLVEFAEKSLLGKARSRPDLARQVIDKARREGVMTTLEAAMNRLDLPMPLGYSSAGTIIAIGESVQGLRAGQRVACAGGGYAVHAEIVCVPRLLATPLPDEVDFEAAAFVTLGAIALHGFRLAAVQLGERVAVIGLGLLGLLALQVASAAGCHVLGIDIDQARVSLAQKMGFGAVLRGGAEEAAMSFSAGCGCDGVLICADTSSPDPVELAGVIARDRARVVAVGAVGLELPRKVYYEKELTFLNSRSYGPGRYDPVYEESGQDYPLGYVRWTEGRNLEAFVDLLASGRVDVKSLITHRFPIQKAPQAYELITGKTGQPFLGVLLTYAEPAEGGKRAGIESKEKTTPTIVRPIADVQTTDKLRLGVLGAGNFALAVMLPALRGLPELELVGIASASGSSAQYAATRFGFAFAASDETAILNDPRINTVAVLTRHGMHARQVVAALQAGKHVFCEKPLALDEQELGEIMRALEAEGRREESALPGAEGHEVAPTDAFYPILTVGFNRRFAPLARRLHSFLSDRREPLVAHYRVNAGYLPLSHWTQDHGQGGGRIIGEACHFIDFLTFLVGSPPRTVSAQGLPDSGRYREDNVVMNFAFPDGSLGTVSYLANGDKSFPKEYVEVFCAGRVAVLDDFRLLETVRDGQRQATRSRLRQDKGHRGEWEAFLSAVLSGGPLPIPYVHIFGVTRASFAALQALRTGELVTI